MNDVKKSLVYQLSKERYEWEHQRKNELNNIISIPLGLISVIIGSIVYFFNDLPQKSIPILYFLFWIFLILSIIGTIVCIIFFLKHQTGYDYAYISDPKDLFNFEHEYINNFNQIKVKVNYETINNQVDNLLYEQYVSATTINIQNNEKKIFFYRHLILFLVLTIILTAITFFVRFPLASKPTENIKIQAIDPIEVNIGNSIPIETITPIDFTVNDEIKIRIENLDFLQNKNQNSNINNMSNNEKESTNVK